MGMARGDQVDTLHMPAQFNVLASSARGVGSRVREHDDDIHFFLVPQTVHQALDGGILTGWVRKGDRGRGWGRPRCGLAHEPDVAHLDPVMQFLDPGSLDDFPVAEEGREIGVAAEAHVRRDDRRAEPERVLGLAEDLGQALGAVVELVVAQCHAIVAHEIQEIERQGLLAQREVVQRAHGPVTGIHEDHRMARAAAHVVHIRGDPGIGARGARAGHRIDIEAHMVSAIGVVVQVRGLQDGDVGIAVLVVVVTLALIALCSEPNRDRERGKDGSRSN